MNQKQFLLPQALQILAQAAKAARRTAAQRQYRFGLKKPKLRVQVLRAILDFFGPGCAPAGRAAPDEVRKIIAVRQVNRCEPLEQIIQIFFGKRLALLIGIVARRIADKQNLYCSLMRRARIARNGLLPNARRFVPQPTALAIFDSFPPINVFWCILACALGCTLGLLRFVVYFERSSLQPGRLQNICRNAVQ